MATVEWNNLPMCTCPHCEEEFQWDDYYDVMAGCTKDCPKCGKVIHVVATDTVRQVLLSDEPDD